MKFEKVELSLQVGEVVTLKKGTLQHSEITGKYYLIRKSKYLGEGHWETMGEKEEIEKEPKSKNNVEGGK